MHSSDKSVNISKANVKSVNSSLMSITNQDKTLSDIKKKGALLSPDNKNFQKMTEIIKRDYQEYASKAFIAKDFDQSPDYYMASPERIQIDLSGEKKDISLKDNNLSSIRLSETP